MLETVKSGTTLSIPSDADDNSDADFDADSDADAYSDTGARDSEEWDHTEHPVWHEASAFNPPHQLLEADADANSDANSNADSDADSDAGARNSEEWDNTEHPVWHEASAFNPSHQV